MPEKSNAIVGTVTTGYECLSPSCDGLMGPNDHGPMISRLIDRGLFKCRRDEKEVGGLDVPWRVLEQMSCWSIAELTAGALACSDERSVSVVLNAGEELWIGVGEEARNNWRCDAFREI
ncbi:hypothetical protein F511_37523 [Dorcoceras hygrometricum]|uniref:Uncharacterized protein n=1 Tax=Dorcoceras hygrometricum TaxID=472368 RepID=A0A2Z7DB23_9LAMI|nr:hypothetical protein F511_37523 [Dorcoceras hygrometricum]